MTGSCLGQPRALARCALATALAAIVNCGSDHVPPTQPSEAGARIASLRARFRTALPAAVETTHQVRRAARVALPASAVGKVTLEDEQSNVAVHFALVGARPAPVAVADGYALYAGALDGADLLHRVHDEGTEDYVVFDARPAREELSYDVDVTGAAGLRLVGNTIEFLDESGAPRLRVAPPYVIDATGARHDAILTIDGCAYDRSGVAPWERAITRPGASHCSVSVAWDGRDARYPLVVDPAWTATGAMATARTGHTATLLASGKVLIAGGSGDTSAELFDAGSGTFAATGSMTQVRSYHTATLLASGKVLIVSGAADASAELFDPSAAGSFTATGPTSVPRAQHTATLLASGKVLVAGGIGAGASAELFDPAGAGSFTPTGGGMTSERAAHAAARLPSGKVLLTGGRTSVGDAVSSELFDPTGAGSFAALATSLVPTRYSHVATTLPSGKVLIVGGVEPINNVTAAAAIFDSAGAGSFAATGSLPFAVIGFGATLLSSGSVLITGGKTGGTLQPGAELFDAAAGKFASTTPMKTGRAFHTATLLASGSVLVTGGNDALTGLATKSAEILGIRAAGGSCTVNEDCVTGVCQDGTCCAGACAGECMTCTAGSGACVAVKSAEDPDSCAKTRACDPNGKCKLNVGQACANGNADCANGQCVDGFCCGQPCAGACDVCAASLGSPANGTCAPAPKGTPGAPSCASALCNGTLATCPTTCSGDVDCAKGFRCTTGTCTQSTGAVCDGDHVVKNATGVDVDCAPYKCDVDRCRVTCSTVDDCVAPSVCDSSGKCVVTADSGDSGGCTIAPAASSRRASAYIVLLACGALVARARKRKAR